MPDLSVPTLNANDTEYILIEWLVADGMPVSASDVVAVIETSKALEDLEAGADGVLRHRLVAGTTCRPGQILGRIGDTESDDTDTTDGPNTSAAPPERIITKPAHDLIRQHSLTDAELARLPTGLVRAADVTTLLTARESGMDATSTQDAMPFL